MDPDMSYIPNTKKMVILLSSEFEYTTTLSGFEIIAIKSGLINISVSVMILFKRLTCYVKMR